ncbi:MAG: GTP-binding protein, partial [Succinivibrio sp.]|nr:GTP-binding protein [Succinivibrio sp.]
MSENAENPAINDENKIPVNIITGFLGSGKTTLLNHWVNSEEFKDTLVLINEFGDVGLDHELVESVDSSVVLLQSGCICCSLQGALVDSLATNFIKAQRGEIPNFKRVIIETTGLADPSGVIGTLNGDDFLLDHYYHDGTITVLDGMFVRDQLKKQYEAVKQIALADIVIVSKTDLIESDELDAIYEITAKINPAAKVFPAVKGNISPKIL